MKYVRVIDILPTALKLTQENECQCTGWEDTLCQCDEVLGNVTNNGYFEQTTSQFHNLNISDNATINLTAKGIDEVDSFYFYKVSFVFFLFYYYIKTSTFPKCE